MELIAFRVCMYKGIHDSGWIDVNNLTVLVGKNESGKTSFLKALHKLNPYEAEFYEITREWPRGRRGERKDEHVVCRARFRLSDEEKTVLAKIAEGQTFPDVVEVSRNYASKLEINFEGGISLDETSAIDIETIMEGLPKVHSTFSRTFRRRAIECLEEVKRIINEGRFDTLNQLLHRHGDILRNARDELNDPPYSVEGEFINQYLVRLNHLTQHFQHFHNAQSNIYDYIIGRLPTFVYMDDYRAFSGNVHLRDIQVRRDEDRLTESDKTFLMILHLSGLDLDILVELGVEENEEKRRERRQDVEDAATNLTKIISNRQSHRQYEVEYRVDGPYFFTCVRDDIDSSLIELEERSKGYQWFFSFDLMLMHETQGTFKNCVILLDEPGLHLHPKTQQDLLRRLEEYAKDNTLLYTTHLPFMIDLNHPGRIRVLKESEEGIDVTHDLVGSSPEARFVLQTALGMDASQSFLVADRNLVVEGVDDHWILTELSNLFRRNKMDGLPMDVFITPGGGASSAVHVAAIMIGQNLDMVALFDSDKAGRDAWDALVKKWLTEYKKESLAAATLLGDAVGACSDFELEDLFPENFYMESVYETYPKVGEVKLQGNDMLWKKVKRALQNEGIKKPNKTSVAKRIRDRISSMEDISELPEETKEKAVKLFEKLRNTFGEPESESS